MPRALELMGQYILQNNDISFFCKNKLYYIITCFHLKFPFIKYENR